MKNPKALHNLTWIPLFLIGLCAIILGLSWLVAGEPWLLDKKANEILLQTTFERLFAGEISEHLPDYLTTVYRFFGWWVISIGLLLILFVQVTRMGTRLARNSVHIVLGIIIIGIYIIEFRFISSSPFVWLTHGLSILYLISVLSSHKLKRFD